MLDAQSKEIAERFFCAIDMLIDNKAIRGLKTFTSRYDINRWGFQQLKKYTIDKEDSQPFGSRFKLCYLSYIVNDYKISADWLLTGKGEMMQTGWSIDDLKIWLKSKEKAAKSEN